MKCDPERFKECQKNNLCHLCDGERLFTPPKQFKKPLKKKKKEGMDFEKRVVKTYNKSVGRPDNRRDTARRRPNSGAIWSLPGDIVTRDALFEAKERGTRTSAGEKTISIHKEWLEKVKEETRATSKQYWFLPFAFKDDKSIYLITDFTLEVQLLDLLHQQEEMIVQLASRVEELEGRLGIKGEDNTDGIT